MVPYLVISYHGNFFLSSFFLFFNSVISDHSQLIAETWFNINTSNTNKWNSIFLVSSNIYGLDFKKST